jgi:hypothetical protein
LVELPQLLELLFVLNHVGLALVFNDQARLNFFFCFRRNAGRKLLNVLSVGSDNRLLVISVLLGFASFGGGFVGSEKVAKPETQVAAAGLDPSLDHRRPF